MGQEREKTGRREGGREREKGKRKREGERERGRWRRREKGEGREVLLDDHPTPLHIFLIQVKIHPSAILGPFV